MFPIKDNIQKIKMFNIFSYFFKLGAKGGEANGRERCRVLRVKDYCINIWCIWYNNYHCWKWTLQPEFNSWLRVFIFHFGEGMDPFVLSQAMSK